MATAPKDGKVFVAGSTGYVGREVVRRLCEEGVATLAHVRPSSSALGSWTQSFSAMGAQTIALPWHQQAIEGCLAENQVTMVFFLLGTTRARAKAEKVAGDIYQAVDYRLASMLLQACMAQTVPPRMIYLSSIGASSSSRSAYLRARGQVEDELAAAGISYLSARPSIITGRDRDDDRPGERLSATIGDGALALIAHLGGTKLQERYRSTSATQLADALVALAFSGEEGCVEGARLRSTTGDG